MNNTYEEYVTARKLQEQREKIAQDILSGKARLLASDGKGRFVQVGTIR